MAGCAYGDVKGVGGPHAYACEGNIRFLACGNPKGNVHRILVRANSDVCINVAFHDGLVAGLQGEVRVGVYREGLGYRIVGEVGGGDFVAVHTPDGEAASKASETGVAAAVAWVIIVLVVVRGSAAAVMDWATGSEGDGAGCGLCGGASAEPSSGSAGMSAPMSGASAGSVELEPLFESSRGEGEGP